jgi:hypothetical protein
MKVKAAGLQKIGGRNVGDLGNGDAGEGQPAPWGNGYAPNTNRSLQPAAEFLLTPRLCLVRLHIQIHHQQRNCEESDNRCSKPQCDTPKTAHAQTLRSRSF